MTNAITLAHKAVVTDVSNENQDAINTSVTFSNAYSGAGDAVIGFRKAGESSPRSGSI